MDGSTKDRVTAIQAINKWLEEQSSESDGGVIGYWALKQVLDEHDNKAEKKTTKDEPTSPVKPSSTATGSTVNQTPASAYLRHLMIHGPIDSKSVLSFINLVRQINTGLGK